LPLGLGGSDLGRGGEQEPFKVTSLDPVPAKIDLSGPVLKPSCCTQKRGQKRGDYRGKAFREAGRGRELAMGGLSQKQKNLQSWGVPLH